MSRQRISSYRPILECLEDRRTPSLTVPAFSSLPGATAVLYLDFDGHFEGIWGSYSNITSPAYTTDTDPLNFSATELSNIEQIWRYVAEDYAPFNINVTTVQPPSFANGISLRVVIGGSSSWAGGSYGGIAYVNSFTNSVVNTAYVFPANLGNGYPKYVGDAASHEAGHAFGLSHQSLWSGSTLQASYYSGPGDGTAPIMGNSYSAARSLWWYGSTSSANTFQNDMDVIAKSANGFGYRVDDHGNTLATAAPLTISGTGSFSVNGIIETMSDFDTFSFTTAGGALAINVNVPAGYNNLDARVELRDANGDLVASADPGTSFNASISYTAVAGTYYVTVASAGMSASATATNYGLNVGQYTLSGIIVPGGASAPAAPANLLVNALSSSQINLTWTDNSDNESGFKIERLVNGVWTQVATVGANVNSWQDSGLAPSTSYSYRVLATNASGDSAYSNTASATTPADAAAPNAPSNLSASALSSTQINLTWSDNSNDEIGFKIQRYENGAWSEVATVGANVTSWQDLGLTASTTYSYRVQAYNAVGDSASSSIASATTQADAQVPAAPTNLIASAKINPSPRANLTWVDNATNEAGYHIYRSQDGGISWTLLVQLGANSTAYADTSVVAGLTYRYKILAYNDVGNSAFSNEFEVTIERNSRGWVKGDVLSTTPDNQLFHGYTYDESGINDLLDNIQRLEVLRSRANHAAEQSLVYWMQFEAELNENVVFI